MSLQIYKQISILNSDTVVLILCYTGCNLNMLTWPLVSWEISSSIFYPNAYMVLKWLWYQTVFNKHNEKENAVEKGNVIQFLTKYSFVYFGECAHAAADNYAMVNFLFCVNNKSSDRCSCFYRIMVVQWPHFSRLLTWVVKMFNFLAWTSCYNKNASSVAIFLEVVHCSDDEYLG